MKKEDFTKRLLVMCSVIAVLVIVNAWFYFYTTGFGRYVMMALTFIVVLIYLGGIFNIINIFSFRDNSRIIKNNSNSLNEHNNLFIKRKEEKKNSDNDFTDRFESIFKNNKFEQFERNLRKTGLLDEANKWKKENTNVCFYILFLWLCNNEFIKQPIENAYFIKLSMKYFNVTYSETTFSTKNCLAYSDVRNIDLKQRKEASLNKYELLYHFKLVNLLDN